MFMVVSDLTMCYNTGTSKVMKGKNMSIEVTSIKSEYPLGTTDGTNYTIIPRR